MKKYFLLFPILFISFKGIAIPAVFFLETDCATRNENVTPLQKEDPGEMNAFSLAMSLSPDTSDLLINECGRNHTEASEQKACIILVWFEFLSFNEMKIISDQS